MMLLLTLNVSGLAFAAEPLGLEFVINTYSGDFQGRTKVAVSETGHFMVVWQSYSSPETDDSSASIQGRFYDASGIASGTQFQVNTFTTDGQRNPAIAVDDRGEFLVVWESGTLVGARDIQAQLYDSEGSPRSGEFRVSSEPAYPYPSVAATADGFMVVWRRITPPSIQGRRYDSDGRSLGSEFRVSAFGDPPRQPSIGSNARGDLVVAWAARRSPDESVIARRYESNGSAIGDEFVVSPLDPLTKGFPRVAVQDTGEFVVAWQDRYVGVPGRLVVARRFEAGGDPVGDEFLVSRANGSGLELFGLDAEPNGGFVVVWDENMNSCFDYCIYGRRWDESGLGEEFRVNTYTIRNQRSPSVSIDGRGDFIVVWNAWDHVNNTSSSIRGQRYVPEPTLPVLRFTAIVSVLLLALRHVERARP